MSRADRTLLYARTHHEIDLVASFLSLVISYSARGRRPTLRTPRQVRTRLGALAAAAARTAVSATVVKEVINRTIIKGAQCGLQPLLALFPTVPWRYTPCFSFIRQIDRAVIEARGKLLARGFRGPSTAVDRNSRYFIFESAEGAFMRAFMRALLVQGFMPDSLIWLHGGFWVHPRPKHAHIKKALRVASAQMVHPAAQVACTELHEEWRQAMRDEGLHAPTRRAKRRIECAAAAFEARKTRRRRVAPVFQQRKGLGEPLAGGPD